MPSSEEVVLAVFRAIEERDAETLFGLYHEDIELLEPPSLPYGYEGIRGRAALQAQIEAAPQDGWLGTWGPLQPTEAERRMHPRVISSERGEVVVEYVTRAVAANGERFDARVLGVYEVRDGRLARGRMFHWDTAAVVAFLDRARQAAAA